MMKQCKRIWGEYYILKMDIRKFFQNIDKDILLKILLRKIKDKKTCTNEYVPSDRTKEC